MELINTHCHSKYCGHGKGEIMEYAQAAADAGITTLAFTEHYPLTSAFDPDGYLSVPQDKMTDYTDAVRQAQKAFPTVEILCGIELDYLSKDDDRNLQPHDLQPFDLVLGSVHFVDRWPFDDPAQRGVWEEEGQSDRIWKRYVDIWCEAASCPSNMIDVMSHPDLAKKFGYMPSFDVMPLYKRMAHAAKSGNKMIELNTSGSYYACKEPFPALPLLHEFFLAGVPCTVGTDAHDPAHVARDIEFGYALMKKVGYKEVTVPTAHGSVRTIEIE